MRKSKTEIIDELRDSFRVLIETSASVSPANYNISKEGKWTTGENIAHLVSATRMTAIPFTLPRFVPVLLYGKPKRTSHGYSKVVNNYIHHLEHGAKASGLYVPKKTNYTQDSLHQKLNAQAEKLLVAIETKWSDEQLDQYQISHPILGLLTLRELAYFTIYHNGHHTEIIRKYYLR